MTSVNSWYPEPVVMDGDGLEWGPIQWADEGTFADADHPEPAENERRFYTIAIRRGWGENTVAASIAVLGVTRDLEIGLETRYRATSEDWTLCDRDKVPASVCNRPPRDSGIPTARKAKFRQVLKRAHDLGNRDDRVDARLEGASELRADGGTSEGDLVDRAVREATALIDAGDSTTVAINYVVDEHELEHRRDDVHQRVCDRLEQVVLTDGGNCLSGTDRLGIVRHVFDSDHQPIEQINHDCCNCKGDQNCPNCPVPEYDPTDQTNENKATYEISNNRFHVSNVLIGRHTTVFRSDNQKCFCHSICRVFSRERSLNTDTELVTDGGRDAFLAGDSHWCDLCETPFETLGELIRHDCRDQQAIADGGRPEHRAICEDCPWSYRNTDLVDVSDEMERHARKEMHDVDLERAVATDGGHCVDDIDKPNRRKLAHPQGHSFPVPIGTSIPSAPSREAIGFPQFSQTPTVLGRSCNNVIYSCMAWVDWCLNKTRITQSTYGYLLTSTFKRPPQPDTGQSAAQSENSTGTEGGDRR